MGTRVLHATTILLWLAISCPNFMGSFWRRSLAFGLKAMKKELKGKLVLGDITRLLTIWSLLESLRRNDTIVKLISSISLWTLEKLSTLSLEIYTI